MKARFWLWIALSLSLGMTGTSDAFHLYRNTDSGCAAASGELTDDPLDGLGNPVHGPIVAEVVMLHNSFNDTAALGPVTRIKVGDAVKWVWSSSHCHSVQSLDPGDSDGFLFYSKFRYPEEPPLSPNAVPGFFEYPVPDPTPTLSYVHTFSAPGTFVYQCEHHNVIGMFGIVVVE